MESLLQDIPNVVVYFDDILVAGKSESEHLITLDKDLSRLKEAGLRKDKCQFLVSSVTYLGYKIKAFTLYLRKLKQSKQLLPLKMRLN